MNECQIVLACTHCLNVKSKQAYPLSHLHLLYILCSVPPSIDVPMCVSRPDESVSLTIAFPRVSRGPRVPLLSCKSVAICGARFRHFPPLFTHLLVYYRAAT